MPLSLRLKKIVEMLDRTELLLDVGCDHAYASIEAVVTGKSKHVMACDVRKGPLEQAKKNIAEAGLSGSIATFLSDGIRELIKAGTYKPDGLIIAGMGGQLMLDILKAKPTDGHTDREQERMTKEAEAMLKAMRTMVLSPQSEPELVRHYIIDELKLNIIDEINICDEGKYYTLIKVSGGDAEVGGSRGCFASEEYNNEIFYKYGLVSCKKREPVFLEGLSLSRERYLKAMESCRSGSSSNAVNKLNELSAKVRELDFILNNEAGF